jgi:hypothetical protein
LVQFRCQRSLGMTAGALSPLSLQGTSAVIRLGTPPNVKFLSEKPNSITDADNSFIFSL